MRKVPLLVGVLLAGVLAGGTVGVMVGASTVPQIHACVEKTTLLMRYTSSAACHTGEKLVTWNVQGVAGAKGATGSTGATGPTGPAGPVQLVASAINANGTAQAPSPSFSSTRVGTGSYQLTFPASVFGNIPIGVITPLSNVTVSAVQAYFNTTSGLWEIDIQLSGDTAFSFIAAELA